MFVKQIAVFMENRKGRICELTEILGKNGIDWLTMSVADTSDFGILRGVTRDNEKAVRVLRDAGFTVSISDLLGVEVNDKPGGLANILKTLDEKNFSVEYLYSFAHAAAGKAVILLKTDNAEAALKALKDNGLKIISDLT